MNYSKIEKASYFVSRVALHLFQVTGVSIAYMKLEIQLAAADGFTAVFGVGGHQCRKKYHIIIKIIYSKKHLYDSLDSLLGQETSWQCSLHI